MSGRPKVLLLGKIDQYVFFYFVYYCLQFEGEKKKEWRFMIIFNSAHKQWKELGQVADLIEPEATDREAFMRECQSGRLDGVVAAFRTFASFSVTGIFDDELVAALPSSWRFLAMNGMGLENFLSLLLLLLFSALDALPTFGGHFTSHTSF